MDCQRFGAEWKKIALDNPWFVYYGGGLMDALHTQIPTCWSRYLRQVVDYFTRRGVDKTTLLACIHVDQRVLDDADARLPVTVFYHVLEVATEMSADPYLALDFITERGLASFDAVGYLALSCKTFGEALERFCHHHTRLFQNEGFSLQLRDDHVSIVNQPWGPDRPGRALYVEMCALACLRSRLRNGQEMFKIPMFRLEHQQRPGTTLEEYERRFGRVPQFGAPRSEWNLPRMVWDFPLPNPNADLVEFFEDYLSHVARPRPAGLSILVQQALERHMEQDAATLKGVAKRLHLSVRSLQRHLADEGRSFEEIVREVRLRLSVVHLDAGLSISDISYRLGYSSESAFHRAFVRWTGTTPARWRERSTDGSH